MSSPIKHIVRFVFFLFTQIFVLNQIPPLHHRVDLYIYFLFILWLPFNTTRLAQLIWGFLLGITLDYFTKSPGLHASACVLIAYLRPFLINLLIPQQGTEVNYEEPSIRSLSFAPYAIYVVTLTIIHHAYLFLLEAIQFADIFYFIEKTLFSAAASLVLILIVELLFVRKQRFRTNA